MRNKQLKKFLFMFVLGLSLLFNFSNAAEIFLEGNTTLTKTYYCGGTRADSSFPNIGITETAFNNIVNNYVENGYSLSEEFDSLMTDTMNYYNNLYGTSFDGYFIYETSTTSGYYRIFIFNRSQADYVGFLEEDFFGYSYLPDSSYIEINVRIPSTNSYYYISGTTEGNCYPYSLSWPLNFNTNTSVKSLTSYSKSSSEYVFVWDGETYLYKVEQEPEIPDFEGITDNQKATIINSIINSTDFSTVPQKYRNQFFIVHNTLTNRYKVYFYPEQYYLKGRIFEEGSTADVNYKSYKIIAFEGSNFLWDLWQSINPFDYYVFSGYFNEDESFTSYFYEYVDSHKLNQHYFNYADEPIVYTSRDIGFVIYNLETGEYDEDSSNSIGSTVLKDDEGNEITIDIPVDDSTVSNTPWNKFLALVQSIPEKIVSSFNNFTGLTKVITIISPLGSAIVIIFGVLLSSISLLSRAVAFVYTLPTIQSSASLFSVDVDATAKGISFVSNSWGSNFLKGLNIVKEFSWNGLNLWTLFTSFIVAIFAIHCIKLVRKHYHY